MIRQLAHRRVILVSLDILPELLSGLEVHITDDRAGVNRIDGRTFGQFTCPGASHRLNGCFGTAIDRLAYETQRRGYTGDAHDAAASVGWEEWGACLCEEERGEDIDRVMPVEVLGLDGPPIGVVQGPVLRYASIIDQDVDLEFSIGAEMLLRGSDDCFHGFGRLA